MIPASSKRLTDAKETVAYREETNHLPANTHADAHASTVNANSKTATKREAFLIHQSTITLNSKLKTSNTNNENTSKITN
jgi:hypothetical protein